METNHENLLALEHLFEKHAAQLATVPKARYRQLANIFDLAINEGDSARIARIWPELVPSIWRAPAVGREFVRAQARLARLAVLKTRWRAVNLLTRMGLH
jgi:hypothetical protein